MWSPECIWWKHISWTKQVPIITAPSVMNNHNNVKAVKVKLAPTFTFLTTTTRSQQSCMHSHPSFLKSSHSQATFTLYFSKHIHVTILPITSTCLSTSFQCHQEDPMQTAVYSHTFSLQKTTHQGPCMVHTLCTVYIHTLPLQKMTHQGPWIHCINCHFQHCYRDYIWDLENHRTVLTNIRDEAKLRYSCVHCMTE